MKTRPVGRLARMVFFLMLINLQLTAAACSSRLASDVNRIFVMNDSTQSDMKWSWHVTQDGSASSFKTPLMSNNLVPEFSSDGLNWSQNLQVCSENNVYDAEDVMKVSFEHLELDPSNLTQADDVSVSIMEEGVILVPNRVEWAPNAAKIGPAQIGSWKVKISDKQNHVLLEFEMVVVAGCRLQIEGSTQQDFSYAWPTQGSKEVEVKSPAETWHSTSAGFSASDCEKLVQNKISDAVFFSRDTMKFHSSVMAWNHEEPYTFAINPEAVASTDLLSDIIPDGMRMSVTALVKHGHSYLHVMTVQVFLIHCKDAIALDEQKLPQLVQKRADTEAQTQTFSTVFEINTHIDELNSETQRPMEVLRNVTFAFKDSAQASSVTDEYLAEICIAEAPNSFQIRCEALPEPQMTMIGQSFPLESLTQEKSSKFQDYSGSPLFSIGAGLVSRTDLCRVEGTSSSSLQTPVGALDTTKVMRRGVRRLSRYTVTSTECDNFRAQLNTDQGSWTIFTITVKREFEAYIELPEDIFQATFSDSNYEYCQQGTYSQTASIISGAAGGLTGINLTVVGNIIRISVKKEAALGLFQVQVVGKWFNDGETYQTDHAIQFEVISIETSNDLKSNEESAIYQQSLSLLLTQANHSASGTYPVAHDIKFYYTGDRQANSAFSGLLFKRSPALVQYGFSGAQPSWLIDQPYTMQASVDQIIIDHPNDSSSSVDKIALSFTYNCEAWTTANAGSMVQHELNGHVKFSSLTPDLQFHFQVQCWYDQERLVIPNASPITDVTYNFVNDTLAVEYVYGRSTSGTPSFDQQLSTNDTCLEDSNQKHYETLVMDSGNYFDQYLYDASDLNYYYECLNIATDTLYQLRSVRYSKLSGIIDSNDISLINNGIRLISLEDMNNNQDASCSTTPTAEEIVTLKDIYYSLSSKETLIIDAPEIESSCGGPQDIDVKDGKLQVTHADGTIELIDDDILDEDNSFGLNYGFYNLLEESQVDIKQVDFASITEEFFDNNIFVLTINTEDTSLNGSVLLLTFTLGLWTDPGSYTTYKVSIHYISDQEEEEELCAGASIAFMNLSYFPTQYLVLIQADAPADAISADSADSADSAKDDNDDKKEGSSTPIDDLTASTDSKSAKEPIIVEEEKETIEQEPVLVIEWPDTLIAYEGSNCDVTISTEVTFLGAGKLGNDWVVVNLEDRTMTIDTLSSAVQAITKNELILAKISIILFDASTKIEIASEMLEFAIKFETPFVEKVKEEVETEKEAEKEEATESTSASEAVEEKKIEEQTEFKGTSTQNKVTQLRQQGEVVKDPIKVSVSMVSETGKIRIEFSRAIKIEFKKSLRQLQRLGRRLQDDDISYTAAEKKQLANLLTIDYDSAADEGSDSSSLVDIEVVEATSTALELKFTHSNPLAVSQDPSAPASISITFDSSVFSDPFSEVSVNDGEPLIVKLPRQIDPEQAAVITSTMDKAQGAANTIATGNVFVNIILGSSLKLLWGMINTLQFVVFFTDWKVQIPPNAILAIQTFRTIALGEFIPYEFVTEPLAEWFTPESDASGEEGEDGSESKAGVLSNMGVMLPILMVLLILVGLICVCVRYNKRGSKLHNLTMKVKKKVFYNSMLRFVLQSYLKTALGGVFALVLINFKTGTDILNAVLAIVMMLILASFPIFFAILLHRKRDILSLDETKEQIGSLYLGIRVNTKGQRLHSSVFLIRRLLYAILTVSCIENPNILIHVFLLTNLMYVVYMGLTSPNETVLARRVEFFNESGLQFITYHLALFPLAPTVEDEELAGFSMIGAICLVFFINLLIMVVVSIGGLKRKLKLRGLKKRLEKEMQLREEKRIEAKKREGFELVHPNSPDQKKAKLHPAASAAQLSIIGEDDESNSDIEEDDESCSELSISQVSGQSTPMNQIGNQQKIQLRQANEEEKKEVYKSGRNDEPRKEDDDEQEQSMMHVSKKKEHEESVSDLVNRIETLFASRQPQIDESKPTTHGLN